MGHYGVMGERMYSLPAAERDKLIVALRAKRWSLAQIGKRVGMSRSGVLRALERIERGDPGVDRRQE
jgi:transcriptional regulator of acetoin/glycerol metabolism